MQLIASLWQPGGAGYYRRIPQLNQTVIDYNDDFQRHRLRALQSVDLIVQNLTKTIDAAGALDNTYIIYTTDNGFHLSQHRLFGGKNCGLETDVNIPFYVRGPGVPAGSTNNAVTSHVDMSPTILALARAPQQDQFDGGVIPIPGVAAGSKIVRHEHITVEHWGLGLIEGIYGKYGDAGEFSRNYRNNTYRSVRLIGDGYSLYYSVWCNGEHEYYDMTVSCPLAQTIPVQHGCTPASPNRGNPHAARSPNGQTERSVPARQSLCRAR